MEPFSTASMLAIAGKLVTTEVTKTAIAGIKRQLQPDEMAVLLQKAIESAQAAEAVHSPTSGLFHGFQPKAGQEFLEKFLRSGEVVKELQKPLQDDGKPDVEMLVAAFTKAAEDRAALGQLSKTSDTILTRVVQWLEQNPNDDRIGSPIDCLWSFA
jgi:hypothetical protein